MGKNTLENTQQISLEIGTVIDRICRKYSIKYTLIGETLFAAYQYKGFPAGKSIMGFAMLYEDYIRFLDKFKDEEFNGEYYIVNQKVEDIFDFEVTLVAKRGTVNLGTSRKSDEVYYDISARIFPLLNAGDSQKEYTMFAKQYFKARRIVGLNAPIRGTTNIRNWKRRIKHYACYIKYRNQQKEMLNKLISMVSKYEQSTNMVLLPNGEMIYKGCINNRSTYTQLEDVEFEGYHFLAIQDARKWILEYYKDLSKIQLNQEINKVMLMGPDALRQIQLIELEMLREVDRICRKHNLKYALFAGTLLGAVRHKGFIPWDDDIDICMLKEDYDCFLKVASKELDKKKYFIRTQETDKDCNLTFAQIKRNNTLYYREGRKKYDTHLGIFIDILPLYNGTDNWFLHKYQLYKSRFLKTMVWSHMGASSEKRKIYSWYYRILSKIPNKTSYSWFENTANMFENTATNKVSYLSAYRNPFNEIMSYKSTYENLIEMEFEGYQFYVPKEYDKLLKYLYADRYMKLPSVESRLAKHTPAVIKFDEIKDIG